MYIFKNETFFSAQTHYWNQLCNAHNNTPHKHEFFEIFYMLSGKITHCINNQNEILTIGDLRIIRPNDTHCCQEIHNHSNSTYRNILVSYNEFQHMCEILSPSLFTQIMSSEHPIGALSERELIHLENLVQQLPSPHSTTILDTTIIYRFILVRILESYYKTSKKLSTKYSVNPIITSILNEINRPSGIFLTPENILAMHNYNHSYICTLFKKNIGCTLSQYINRRRLEYAEILIKTNNYSLQQVAELTGFHNYSYFHRVFLAFFKKTPQQMKTNK